MRDAGAETGAVHHLEDSQIFSEKGKYLGIGEKHRHRLKLDSSVKANWLEAGREGT